MVIDFNINKPIILWLPRSESLMPIKLSNRELIFSTAASTTLSGCVNTKIVQFFLEMSLNRVGSTHWSSILFDSIPTLPPPRNSRKIEFGKFLQE